MNVKKEIDALASVYSFRVLFTNLYCDCAIAYAPHIDFQKGWMVELQRSCDQFVASTGNSYREMRYADHRQILRSIADAPSIDTKRLIKWFADASQSREDIGRNSRAFEILSRIGQENYHILSLEDVIGRVRTIYIQEVRLKWQLLTSIEGHMFLRHKLSEKDRILIDVDELGYEESPPTPIKYLSMAYLKTLHIACMRRCDTEIGRSSMKRLTDALVEREEFGPRVEEDLRSIR